EVSAVLTSSLDYDETVQRVVRLMVPALGDWSVLHVIEDDGVRWLACHRNPLLDAKLREQSARLLPLSLRHVLPETLFTGRATLAVDNARTFRRAQQAAETRRDLVAVVAHDLKNPLNAVSMAAALLSKSAPAGADGDRARRQTNIIMRASDRMNRLIHDLLDVSAIDAGRLELEPLPQRIGPLVSERSEEHTSELQSPYDLVCRLPLEKKKSAHKKFPSASCATPSPPLRVRLSDKAAPRPARTL